MNGEAVKEVERLAREAAGQLVTIDDVTYSTTPLHDVRRPTPLCEPVKLHTLSGMADFVRLHVGTEGEVVAVHVVSHSLVRFMGAALEGAYRQREVYATVGHEDLFGGGFRFGQFIDAEQFVVAMQTLFVDSDDREAVLAVMGNLREEEVRTTGDDGVTQTVTAKAGVVLSKDVRVPNPVSLRPYRTFREVLQPASSFVLRLQGGGKAGSTPSAALFEADGGAWKVEAIRNISVYLRSSLPDGVTVIA